MAVGNRGLAGSIAEDAMAGALWAGYATTGTDKALIAAYYGAPAKYAYGMAARKAEGRD